MMPSTPTPTAHAYGSDDEVVAHTTAAAAPSIDATDAEAGGSPPPSAPLSPQPLRFSDGAAGSGAGVLSSGSSSSPAAISQLAPPCTPPSQPQLTPFEAMCPPPHADLADYTRVTHSFATVAGQVAHGLDAIKSVAEFVRRVCAAKNAYASELLKTAATASSSSSSSGGNSGGGGGHNGAAGAAATAGSKVAPGGSNSSIVESVEPDSMAGASRLWGDLKSQLFEEARMEQEVGAKLAAEVVVPMMSFHAEASRKSKIVLAHQQALAGQMRALTEGQLLQAKIAAVRSVAALQAAEARERDAAIAARQANPDILAPIPPPPAHSKWLDLVDTGAAAGGLGGTGGPGSKGPSSTSKVEASTRRALASVGSFFKNLGKKDKEQGNAAAAGGGAGGAAPGSAASAPGAGASDAAAGSALSGAPSGAPSSDAPSSSSSTMAAVAPAASSSSSGGESSEELRERAYQAALSYQLAVASSNARQEQYFRSDLPQLFAELQRLEVARLNCLRHYVSLLAAARLSLTGPTQQRLESLLASAGAIDPPSETRRFAGEIVARVGEAQQPNPFVYDLDFRPETIRGAKMDAAAAPHAPPTASAPGSDGSAAEGAVSCFTSSLGAQMDLTDAQHASLGGELLDVPRALHVLVEAIRARKGFHRGGLFSAAAPASEVAALRAAFESADFDCSKWSLEALAGALKAWLRGLPEPLLSAPLYNAAIQACKKDAASAMAERHERAEAAALAAAKPSPTSSSASSSASDAHPVQSLDGVERSPVQSAAAAAVSPSAMQVPSAAASTAISSGGSDRSRSSSLSGSSLSLPPAPVQSLLPSAQLQQYAQSINAALPTLNQRVLAVLAMLLSDMATAGAQVQLSSSSSSSSSSHSHAASPRMSTAAGAGAGGLDEAGVQTDWNRWAASMTHNSAIFASAILRNTQADTTELLSNSKHELRFCAALLMTVAQAAMQRAQPPLSPPLSPKQAHADATASSDQTSSTSAASSVASVDRDGADADADTAPAASPHAAPSASPTSQTSQSIEDAEALAQERPPPLVTSTSDSQQ